MTAHRTLLSLDHADAVSCARGAEQHTYADTAWHVGMCWRRRDPDVPWLRAERFLLVELERARWPAYGPLQLPEVAALDATELLGEPSPWATKHRYLAHVRTFTRIEFRRRRAGDAGLSGGELVGYSYREV